MEPSKPTTEISSNAATLGSNLPPVAVPLSDQLARDEASDTFADSERHNLYVRKLAAWACLLLVAALYSAGLVLLCKSASFAEKLCTPVVASEHASQVAVVAAVDRVPSVPVDTASEAPHDTPTKNITAHAVSESGSAVVSAHEAARTSSTNCDNALALLNSHAMVGALVALFSIPTVLLIVLLRAFASGKKEKAVPDTVVSWLAEKFAAAVEKATGSKD